MEDKKALIVIDLQNDFLGEGRRPMFSYNSDELAAAVNRSIASYREAGCDIIYIKQYYHNIITNRLLIGFAIKGTPGAEIYDKIDIVSDNIFVKYLPNTYSSRAFREFMERHKYTEVILCGVDECGCVGATAKGAVKTGVKVKMLTDSIGCRFPESKIQKMRTSLQSLGVEYI